MSSGDTLLLQSAEGIWGDMGSYDEGLIMGLLTGDGTFCEATGGITRVCLDFWNDRPLAESVCLKYNTML